MRVLGTSLVLAVALATLAGLFGWWLHSSVPEGMVSWTHPNRCLRPVHSFGVGFGFALSVMGAASLLFAAVSFFAALLPHWRHLGVSLRRKALVALLVPPFLLALWPVHRAIETLLPQKNLPGCPPHVS